MRKLHKYIICGAIGILCAGSASAQEKQAVNPDFLIINQNPNRHEAVIYPNPSSGKVVKIKSSILIKSIEIMTMIGKCVQQQLNPHMLYDDITLDLKSCNPGTYYAKITFEDNQTVIKKLILRK
ncbi:MAG: T9SS type A sorting domain-containing protein [Bacteroidales bacterium]|nr:T9SS type A sorting domain-containing protein [Bacteroidales bacterium]